MCWKYEPLYDGQCFDYMVFKGFDECLIDFLEEHYDIDVVDANLFISKVFRLLTELHENHIIKPLHPTGLKPIE